MKRNLIKKTLVVATILFFSLQYASAANYYWVGGTGNWSNYAAHWATTSGGNVFHTQVPTSFDNVYFDANSFPGPAQIVTNDTTIAYCRDMDWTGATNNPVYEAVNSTIELKVFGSFTLNPIINFSFNGKLTFTSFNAGKTIATFGRVLQCPIEFNGAGGEWTLLDSLTSLLEIKLTYGTLRTNDNNIRCRNVVSYNTNARAFYLGTSTVKMTLSWFISRSIVLDADSSIIRLNDGGGFHSEGHTYNIIQWDSTSSSSQNILKYDSMRINKVISYNSASNSRLKITCIGCQIDTVLAFSVYETNWPGRNNKMNYISVHYDAVIYNSGINSSYFGDSINRMNVTGNIFLGNYSGARNFISNLTAGGYMTIGYGNPAYINRQTFDTCTVGGNASILSPSNRLGIFSMTPGKTLTLRNDSTNYIDSLIATGTPGFPIQIISSDLGHAANVVIQEDLCTDYLYIHAVHASGNPALYVGSNSNDVNNNTGWIFSNCITGIEENNFQESVLIYPNPATNELRVQSSKFNVESVEVYDVVGERCLTLTLSKGEGPASINVSKLAPGIYFVKVRWEKEERVAKFVKQ
ncbi:MAG TPA: T9SS type A sorting domain-containing protein [Bacteroidia bacterium]|nr:T9SS type A sorting domain-containing protein [Bacteroidia bacterium]